MQLSLAHDNEKHPACEKIEQIKTSKYLQLQDINLLKAYKIYFCKLRTHFIADFNTYGSILIQLLHFSLKSHKELQMENHDSPYHTSFQNPI